jgi:hypothetical protein
MPQSEDTLASFHDQGPDSIPQDGERCNSFTSLHSHIQRASLRHYFFFRWVFKDLRLPFTTLQGVSKLNS